MPSQSTIKNWLKEIHFSTGHNEDSYDQIKLKVETSFTKAVAYRTIMYDEIRIRSSLDYNKHSDVDIYDNRMHLLCGHSFCLKCIKKVERSGGLLP